MLLDSDYLCLMNPYPSLPHSLLSHNFPSTSVRQKSNLVIRPIAAIRGQTTQVRPATINGYPQRGTLSSIFYERLLLVGIKRLPPPIAIFFQVLTSVHRVHMCLLHDVLYLNRIASGDDCASVTTRFGDFNESPMHQQLKLSPTTLRIATQVVRSVAIYLVFMFTYMNYEETTLASSIPLCKPQQRMSNSGYTPHTASVITCRRHYLAVCGRLSMTRTVWLLQYHTCTCTSVLRITLAL